MPMIDIQRRHAELFRIRLGDKGPNGQPRKLTEQIRVTAAGAETVQSFVDVYGGQVAPFDDERSRHRFQAYLPTDTLSVLVLPGNSISQWWEKYKGSVCERRCDGMTEQKSSKPCMCPADIEARMADRNGCSPMTRVNVLCPDVAVVGSGALVSHGLIAAETLPQSIAVAEAALSRGLMVPATLRVVEHKGRNHFIVPQIEIVGVSLNQLTTGELRSLPSAPQTAAVTAGEMSQPAFQPVGQLPPGPQPTVAEQVAAAAEPKARPARKNAQTPIPATSVRPRTAAQAAAPMNGTSNTPDRFHKVGAAKGLEEETRRALISRVSNGRTASAGELTADELMAAFALLDGENKLDPVFDLAQRVADISARGKALSPAAKDEYTRFIHDEKIPSAKAEYMAEWTPELCDLAESMLLTLEESASKVAG